MSDDTFIDATNKIMYKVENGKATLTKYFGSKTVPMYAPIITEFFDNEEEMAKFQKWREEQEAKERLEKEEKAKKKAGAANGA